LLADYRQVFSDYEVYLAESAGVLDGVLILEPRADDLLIWSVASNPAMQGAGIGRALLAAAEVRAHQLGRSVMRLYTGTPLAHLIAWYGRHGYAIERIEALSDRSITHMIKHLGCAHGEKNHASKEQRT
jgi:GNAT superfamily N-acetyltransferase